MKASKHLPGASSESPSRRTWSKREFAATELVERMQQRKRAATASGAIAVAVPPPKLAPSPSIADSDVPTPTVSRSGRGLAAPDRLIEKIEPGAAAQLKKMRNFSGEALAVLERVFAARQQPDARQLAALAVVLGATRERVDLWFERQRRGAEDGGDKGKGGKGKSVPARLPPPPPPCPFGAGARSLPAADDEEAKQAMEWATKESLAVAPTTTLAPGARVVARYQRGVRWYPGTLGDLRPDGTARICYDDGDVDEALPRRFLMHENADTPPPAEGGDGGDRESGRRKALRDQEAQDMRRRRRHSGGGRHSGGRSLDDAECRGLLLVRSKPRNPPQDPGHRYPFPVMIDPARLGPDAPKKYELPVSAPASTADDETASTADDGAAAAAAAKSASAAPLSEGEMVAVLRGEHKGRVGRVEGHTSGKGGKKRAYKVSLMPPPPPLPAALVASAGKKARGAAGGAYEAAVGERVEVIMVEEGLRGAKYAADVLGRKAGAVHVEHYHLFDEDDESLRLKEWAAAAQVVREPPPPPDGWLSGVRVGQQLEMRHEEGWWPVKVLEAAARRKGASSYLVEAVGYGVQRRAAARLLRPIDGGGAGA